VRLFAVVLLVAASAVVHTTAAGQTNSSAQKNPAPSAENGQRTTAQPSTQKPVPAKPPMVSPDEGSVKGNRYTSDYFAFSYSFPERFEVMEDLMQGEQDITKQAFVLLAAYGAAEQDTAKQGIVILADRFQASPPNSNWASGYFDTLAQPLQAHGSERVGTVREYSFAGRKFFREDFHRTGPDAGYHTILLTQCRGYVVGFQFVAPTEMEIDQLIMTLNTLKFASTNAHSGPVLPN
jgi:hypothetical protein